MSLPNPAVAVSPVPWPGGLEALLASAARRIRLLRLMSLASRALCITTVAALSAIGLSRLRLMPQPDALSVGALISAGVIVAAVLAWTRRLTPLETARSIEARADLKERLSSAVAFRQEAIRSPFFSAQQADAERCAAGVDVHALFPLRAPREFWIGAFAAGLLALFFLLPALPKPATPARKQEQALVRRHGAAIQKIARAAEIAAKQQNLQETQKAVQQAKRLADAMQQSKLTKKQTLVEMQKLTKKIEEAQKRLAAQSAPRSMEQAQGDFQRSLEQRQRDAEKAQNGKSDAKNHDEKSAGKNGDAKDEKAKGKPPASDAMKQAMQSLDRMQQGMKAEDNRKMQEAMGNLARQMQSGKLSPREMQQLRQSLQDLAKALSNTQQDQAAKMLQQLPQAPQNGKQMNAETLRKLAEQMNAITKQMGQGNRTQRDRQALQELADALKQGRMEMGMGRKPGEGTSAQAGQPKPGSGNPSGSNNARQNSGDLSAGGRGAGTGAGTPQSGSAGTRSAAQKPNTKVTGQRSRDSQEAQTPLTGSPGSARSSAPLYRSYESHRRAAENALDRENIPAVYKRQVRDYFDSIRPGKH